MCTQVNVLQTPSDDSKPTTTATSTAPPHRSSSCAPETPPLIDPNNFRFPRLTPNLKEMIQSWNPAFHDSHAPSTDIFASPDPTAMYNSITMPSPSPLFKDFCQTSPLIGVLPPYLNPEYAERAHRAEKLSVVCEEMNGLFANLPNPQEENRSDNNVDAVASNISSPAPDPQPLKQSHPRTKSESIPEQSQTASTNLPHNTSTPHHTSQSSYETRHLLETSSLSPSSSPQLKETRVMKKSSKSRKSHSRTPSTSTGPKKSSSKSDKPKRPPTRPQIKSQPKITAQLPAHAAVTALAAANPYAINPAMAGLIPFPGAIAAGIPQMYPGAGVMIYQGRPMAVIAGARGPELIPIDMLAHAQYGAAQALQAASQMNSARGSRVEGSQTDSLYDSGGSSRKKRRRQMLDRSGCSEEQARENRARALKRLRQKKTVRSQSSTVRYACRRKIAMVRPRVNGRFATKEEVESQQESLVDQ